MGQYDFSTLNDKDLEELSRDLLTRELYIPFQSFKVGKDGGIDLRYSTNTSENKIIVQVKHYLKSGFNALLNKLKNEEKIKIDRLNPNRYLLVTSVSLSPADKAKIKKILCPHILSTNDIYGADDINMLLSKHPEIEKKHFKLWFSNTNIIQKIINNGIDGRSTFFENKIKKNIELYVINQSFEKALNILSEQKILIITGTPGIGKTTLANLITYHLLSKDFRLVYIDEKIKEAEDMFDNDSNAKQVFYFDDFLGSNYLDIINLRNSENSIVNFIDRIQATKNKHLILTTRSTILNQAKSRQEKLKRANLDSLKYELEITSYNDYDKAKILYNHLYFNSLDAEMINEIFRDKNYRKIIQHKNYNPRLIEYFTKEQNVNHLTSKNYFNFIINSLDNPEEIWGTALTNQLNSSEKYLLFVLLSLGRYISVTNLEEAFDAKIKHEVVNHGFTREINIFKISLKNLMDGYIKNTMHHHLSAEKYIGFINPSLGDYLTLFFNENNTEKWRLIESFVFIEQFDYMFKRRNDSDNKVIIDDSEIKKYIEMIYVKKLSSIETKDDYNIILRKIRLIYSYKSFDNENHINDIILSLLNNIDWAVINICFINDVLDFLEQVDNKSPVFNFLLSKWNIVIEKLVDVTSRELELERIQNLFVDFDFKYFDYLDNNIELKEKIINSINRIFEEKANDIIEQEQAEVYSEEDFAIMEQRVSDYFYKLSNTYLREKSIEQTYFPCNDIDIESLIEDNQKISEEADIYEDDWKSYEKDALDQVTMVDDLFSMIEKA